MTSSISPDTQRDLAPTGKLRVGLNYGNFLLVLRDKPDGTPQGIAPDLARELAKRLEMAIEFVKFDAAGKLADGVKTMLWDVAFLGNEPQRAAEIAFSPAYLEIPVTYLVPAGSPIQALADVDKQGVRVAVADKSAYHLFMMRELKNAELVSADGIDGSYKLFIDSKLDAEPPALAGGIDLAAEASPPADAGGTALCARNSVHVKLPSKFGRAIIMNLCRGQMWRAFFSRRNSPFGPGGMCSSL